MSTQFVPVTNPLRMTIVSADISRYLRNKLSVKHQLALISLAGYAKHHGTITRVFGNGNVWYLGRNTAYKMLKDYGFKWDAKVNDWIAK